MQPGQAARGQGCSLQVGSSTSLCLRDPWSSKDRVSPTLLEGCHSRLDPAFSCLNRFLPHWEHEKKQKGSMCPHALKLGWEQITAILPSLCQICATQENDHVSRANVLHTHQPTSSLKQPYWMGFLVIIIINKLLHLQSTSSLLSALLQITCILTSFYAEGRVETLLQMVCQHTHTCTGCHKLSIAKACRFSVGNVAWVLPLHHLCPSRTNLPTLVMAWPVHYRLLTRRRSNGTTFLNSKFSLSKALTKSILFDLAILLLRFFLRNDFLHVREHLNSKKFIPVLVE